jgi:hypothetical protein
VKKYTTTEKRKKNEENTGEAYITDVAKVFPEAG